MAAGGISAGLSFEDYSLYSNLSDDQVLQIAMERSLNDTHSRNPNTTSNTYSNATSNATSNLNPEIRHNSQNPPPAQSLAHYSSPNPPREKPPDPEEEPLFKAIRVGDVNRVKIMVMCPGTNLMLPSKPGWLALHQAAWHGQDSCLRVLLSAQPGTINKRTEHGESALLLAVSREEVTCVQVLLEKGADTEITNHDKETPLYKACERDSAVMVAALLNHGVAVNTRCIQGCTALQEAVVRNNVEICEMLLKAGAKHNLTNMFGISPLFTAAQYGQVATLRFLLKQGADINTQADDGATALYEAAKNGREESVRFLLSQNADANKPGKSGLLPLHIAAQRGNSTIVSMLIPATSKARVRRAGISPLHLAAERERDDVLELLIEAGFDVNAQLSEERSQLYEDRRSTALYFSVINNNMEAVSMLLAAGADPNLDLLKPLMVAVRQSCVQATILLVKHGADINACIPMHPTTFPPIYMFAMKDLPMFKYLLDQGGHARSCFDCCHGSKPHPPIKTTRSERDNSYFLDETQLRRSVQFCEMISAPSICRWAGPIIDVLLDYVGHVTLCSRLMEHLDSYSEWSNIKEKATSPRSLMQNCRLQILQLVARPRVKKLPLPGVLIRFLQHGEGSIDD